MIRSDKFQPLVTVYMPTYNRVELLQRAVKSVLNQDYKNIELIIVDDNSTDDTHEYLTKMAEADSRFKFFINEKNSGACVSRNKAIFSAKGEFITGLDDDDYFLPNHVSSLVTFWKDLDSKYMAVYPNTYLKKNSGLVKLRKRLTPCSAKDLIVSNSIGNQIFTKTNYLKEIGGFDENIPAWQDLECWYRLLKHFNSKAISTGSYSYVYDMSHPHERISTSKIDSVIFACNYLSQKHMLTKNEKQILEVQLWHYTNEHPNLRVLLKRLIYQPRLHNLERSTKIFLEQFKK